MTQSAEKIILPPPFPDHTQLPDEDGTFVKNFQEHPQSIILTDSLTPTLEQRHPDGQYAIGQDCGIYWRETQPPQDGAESPDWFYVANVPPDLDGQVRRSYVLWREFIAPLIALEFASGSGKEERDTTTLSPANLAEGKRPGKFWVYENIIRIPYYGIYVIKTGELEMYQLINGAYQRMSANARGHYPIEPLGVELGLWQGNYQNQHQLWMRWWDREGNLLLTGWEQNALQQMRTEQAESLAQQESDRAEQAESLAREERDRAEQAESRAQQESDRAEQAESRAQQAEQAQQKAVPRLLAMGLSAEQVAETLSLTVEQVNSMSS
ncbi:Uma2 family endonuclease [Roseofilum casamattae]|uniref:Uma2 family endonuclease n=1 Tax=Roseofilum casamattae BLCC-M143 TaxID=3022442 RepID=A0ABT7C3M6_9CYAN|nr:Uma2 family endonuclease [Roseofilum casamattae]MDJ1185389.1 Uma2 family endonuclease [Roseofilum casamattae BLCC-M143]